MLEQKLFRNDTGIQAREVGGLLTLHRQQSSFALCEHAAFPRKNGIKEGGDDHNENSLHLTRRYLMAVQKMQVVVQKMQVENKN